MAARKKRSKKAEDDRKPGEEEKAPESKQPEAAARDTEDDGKMERKRRKGGQKQDEEAIEIVKPTGDIVTLKPKLKKKLYEKELARLHLELVKLQYWVKTKGLRVVLVFEGRDAAGKGSTILRVTEPLNPRGCRVVALATPSDREKTQWYFQRYVAHLPGAGEIVIMDRSWYNRAGVERVFGFCTDDEYKEFMRSCPEFERMLVRSGIILLKYWFSVSDEEQEQRFQDRAQDPMKRWKLSNIDLDGRDRWVDYSKAKDEMFFYTDIPEARWHTVESDDKRRARLNCIRHILDSIAYEDVTPKPMKLRARKEQDADYQRPPKGEHLMVPDRY